MGSLQIVVLERRCLSGVPEFRFRPQQTGLLIGMHDLTNQALPRVVEVQVQQEPAAVGMV